MCHLKGNLWLQGEEQGEAEAMVVSFSKFVLVVCWELLKELESVLLSLTCHKESFASISKVFLSHSLLPPLCLLIFLDHQALSLSIKCLLGLQDIKHRVAHKSTQTQTHKGWSMGNDVVCWPFVRSHVWDFPFTFIYFYHIKLHLTLREKMYTFLLKH